MIAAAGSFGLFSACAQGPGTAPGQPPRTRAPVPPETRTDHIDWAGLDWMFPRDLLILTYLFDIRPADDPFAAYRRGIRYQADRDSLGLEAFLALPGAEQAARRDEAAGHRDRALGLRRAQQAWWQRVRDNPGGYSPTGTPPEYAGDGVTMALGQLVTACGLDPGDAGSWSDLSYLYGVVGDVGRQTAAQTAALAALDRREDVALRQRVLLDRAWAEREAGRFETCLETVAAVAALMRDDAVRTPDQALEVRILQALALAGTGRAPEARRLANGLPEVRLPRRQPVAAQDSEMRRAVHKNALQAVASDFATRWVRALAFMKLEQRERALAQFQEADFRTEFPARLNDRFWQDAGRVQEHFGEIPAARLSYVMAAVDRPLFIYFPMIGAQGQPQVYGQTGTGGLYFLGYRHFYLCGSLYAYAANRVLAVELADDPAVRRSHIAQALAALDACQRWGIRPAGTLALRGRVHYRAGDPVAAEADLARARSQLRALGQDDADVHLLLGTLRFNRRDYGGAAPVFADYTKLRPEEALGWRLLGLTLIHAGQPEAALEALDRALALAPASASGLYNRSLLHLQQGRVTAARDDLDRARRLWPDNADFVKLADLLDRAQVPRLSLAHDELDVALEASGPAAGVAVAADQGSRLQLIGRSGGELARLGLGPDDAAALLDGLRSRYVAAATPGNRKAYAWALLQAERPRDVQRLLADRWGAGLDVEELEMLLRADRDLGATDRARALVRGLGRGEDGPADAALWELVAAICLEGGARDAALGALDRALALEPQNAALGRLRKQAGLAR